MESSPQTSARDARQKARRHPLIQALPERIKTIAERQRLTSLEIASRLGVSHQTVVSWWNGVNVPPLEMLIALSEVLGVQPASFLEEPDARVRAMAYHAEMLTALAGGQTVPQAESLAVEQADAAPADFIAILELVAALKQYLPAPATSSVRDLKVVLQRYLLRLKAAYEEAEEDGR